MITFAYNDDAAERTIVYIVIERGNIEHMTNGDPLTLPPKSFGGVMERVRYAENLGLVICYEADGAKLRAIVKGGDFDQLVHHLTRNLTVNDEKAALEGEK
jgi:hypothetical protein